MRKVTDKVKKKLYYQVTKQPGDTFKEWPFDQRFQLIMNIAVGGGWEGAQGVDETIWPQRMEIDYVRVYQVMMKSDAGCWILDAGYWILVRGTYWRWWLLLMKSS